MAIGDEMMREQLQRAARQAMTKAPEQRPQRIIQPRGLKEARETGRYHDQTGETPWSSFRWGTSPWG